MEVASGLRGGDGTHEPRIAVTLLPENYEAGVPQGIGSQHAEEAVLQRRVRAECRSAAVSQD